MINPKKYHLLKLDFDLCSCGNGKYICHNYVAVCLKCFKKTEPVYINLMLYTELESNFEEFFKLLYSI